MFSSAGDDWRRDEALSGIAMQLLELHRASR
jgi:hypothetical protein